MKKKKLLNTSDLVRGPFKRTLYGLIRPTLERVLAIDKLNELYAQTADPAKSPVEFAEEAVVPAVDRALLSAELARLPQDQRLYQQKEFDVWYFEACQAPYLLREIGRLRELTFREAGGGTGRAIDLDGFDEYYLQLVIWNREKEELVGAYRVGPTDKILPQHNRDGLYTSTLFEIDTKLFAALGPSLELGRSFVRTEYQRSYWPLLLLWIGIGHYLRRFPQYRFLLGAASISADFQLAAQSYIALFLIENIQDKRLSQLVQPRNPFKLDAKLTTAYYNTLITNDIVGLHQLLSLVENREVKLPALLRHYLRMNAKLLTFNVDAAFNNVLDGLMFIDLTKTPADLMRKYMTVDGYADYMARHGG